MDDVNQPLVEVSEMSNSEPASVDPEELVIPGALGSRISLPDASQSPGVSLEATNARIDLYAALATSARLSSLVVVLVIIGRHMTRKTPRLRVRMESSSEVGLVDPAPGNILVGVGIVEENEKGVEEMRKARKALYVLVELVNVAAPTSSLTLLEYSSPPITHRPVFTTHQDLVIATSRPGCPVPQLDSRWATPLRDVVEKLRSAASTPIPGWRVSLCVHHRHYGRHSEGSNDAGKCDEEHSRVWRSANTSPVPPFISSPSTNGSSEDDKGDGDFVDAPKLAVTPTRAIGNKVKSQETAAPQCRVDVYCT